MTRIRSSTICPQCGVGFTRSHGQQRMCSRECRKSARKKYKRDWARNHYISKLPSIQHCHRCGGLFRPTKRQIYCSTRCRYQSANLRRRKRGILSAPVRTCVVCGSKFKASGVSLSHSQCCGNRCMDLHRKAYNRRPHRIAYNRKRHASRVRELRDSYVIQLLNDGFDRSMIFPSEIVALKRSEIALKRQIKHITK